MLPCAHVPASQACSCCAFTALQPPFSYRIYYEAPSPFTCTCPDAWVRFAVTGRNSGKLNLRRRCPSQPGLIHKQPGHPPSAGQVQQALGCRSTVKRRVRGMDSRKLSAWRWATSAATGTLSPGPGGSAGAISATRRVSCLRTQLLGRVSRATGIVAAGSQTKANAESGRIACSGTCGGAALNYSSSPSPPPAP